ncbi:MAG: hypothetical protein ABIZ81_02940 [Opitutaceae bacterium]
MATNTTRDNGAGGHGGEARRAGPKHGAVAGGYASTGPLAWIALVKYVDHLPPYRNEQILLFAQST